MSKDTTNFERIMAGLSDATDIAKGRANPKSYRVHVPDDIDVKALRERLGLTQGEFALRYGFEPGTVKGWEQHRREPTGAVRAYLTVIAREPRAVERALRPKERKAARAS